MGVAEILGSVSGKCQGTARAEVERSERILIAVQVFERNEARQVEFGQPIVGAIEGFQGGKSPYIQKDQGEIVAIQGGDVTGRFWLGRSGTGPKRNRFRRRDVLGQAGAANEKFTGGILNGKISGCGGDKSPVFLSGTIGHLDGWG